MRKTAQNVGDWRIYALFVFILAIFLLIFFRLYFLQVVSYDKYKSIADGQYRVFEQLNPKRGGIYMNDQKGYYPLAINRDLEMAYAVPREIDNVEDFSEKISAILGIDKQSIFEKASKNNDSFEILKHKLSDDEVQKIKELGLSGIHLAPESFRYYPAGKLAAHLVGFVGWKDDGIGGRYGLEAFWDKDLKGQSGILNQEEDAGGRWISIADREFQPAKDGVDLILTLDYAVQYEVEKILQKTIEKHGADNGLILVMEPHTGRILALANNPGFDPNEYSKVEDMSVFINSAVSDAFETGSVMKAITMAIGIDDEKIEPDSTYVDTGVVNEAGYEIKNSDEKGYGLQTMTQVLEKSLNTGVIHVESLVGNRKFLSYLKRFGFGEKSAVNLPGESAGDISNLDHENRNIEFYTASYGQGITATPLQVANAYAAIANGGKLMKPQIVEKIIYSDKQEKEIFPEEIRRVVSEETAAKVSQMLRSVVVNGHGNRADVPGYLVVGKTGTAQVAKKGEKGYEEGVAIGSFVGFAPMNDPRFVVFVKISNPKDVLWAESCAAPAFGEVMSFLLQHYGIKPTEPIK